jgi:hypothetical protein
VNDSPDEPLDTQAMPDFFVSPLRRLATEAHEIYGELTDVGFPPGVAAQIIGDMLATALVNRVEDDDDEDDTMEEDDDDDEWDGQGAS